MYCTHAADCSDAGNTVDRKQSYLTFVLHFRFKGFLLCLSWGVKVISPCLSYNGDEALLINIVLPFWFKEFLSHVSVEISCYGVKLTNPLV